MDVVFVRVGGKDKLILTAQDFLRKLHPDLMGFLRRHLPRLKRLDQMAAQVRPLVDGVAAGPGKFDIRGFGGAAWADTSSFPSVFSGVADIVNGPLSA